MTLLPHLASYNYFLADSEEMLVVETHPERVRVRTAEGGVLVAVPRLGWIAFALGAPCRKQYIEAAGASFSYLHDSVSQFFDEISGMGHD